MSFFSELEQVLHIPKAEITNCLPGQTDDKMGVQYRHTIRRQRQTEQQQIISKKHRQQLQKCCEQGRLNLLLFAWQHWKYIYIKILIYMSS